MGKRKMLKEKDRYQFDYMKSWSSQKNSVSLSLSNFSIALHMKNSMCFVKFTSFYVNMNSKRLFLVFFFCDCVSLFSACLLFASIFSLIF